MQGLLKAALIIACVLSFVCSPALKAFQPQSDAGQFEELVRRAEDAIGKRPLEAASLYRQALAIKPKWAEGWLYLGATLLDLDRYRESRDALRKGAELQPSLGTAWAYLGLAEYQLSEFRDALVHILKGESLGLADRPEFIAAVRYHAALIDLRLSDPASALAQLRPLIRTGVESPKTIQALGISALGLETLPDSLTPQQRPLVEMAGHATWAFLGEHADTAKPIFDQLVQQYPNTTGVHYMDGVFLIDRDALGAMEQFRKELTLSPKHVLARVQLSLLLIQQADFEGAVNFAREAAKLDPGNALCQVTLGRALLAHGDLTGAIAMLEKGAQIAPEAARTHFYLQQAYQRAGRTSDAQREKLIFNKLRAEQEPETVPTPEARN